MISVEEFVTMKRVAHSLIEAVFSNEDNFKCVFLKHCRWENESHEIERVHVSGSRMRVTIRFEDLSDYDLYVELDDVYSWYSNLMED